MTLIDFLLKLRREISLFTERIADLEGITVEERREEILKFELAIMYYEIIEYYFRGTGIPDDQNIMEPEELQIVLDKLNNIMNTYLYIDDIVSYSSQVVVFTGDTIFGIDTDPDYVFTGDEDMVE
jgi:hypothetical protein